MLEYAPMRSSAFHHDLALLRLFHVPIAAASLLAFCAIEEYGCLYGLNARIVAFGWQPACTGMRLADRLRLDRSQNAPERRAHVLPNT